MLRNKTSLIFYALIGLAVFGFIASLIDNPIGLIISLVISLAIGGAIFGLIYFFFFRNRGTDELKKYRKAVKQSKQRYKNKNTSRSMASPSMKKTNIIKKKKRKDVPHLRVIEGNKNKKKNRISL